MTALYFVTCTWKDSPRQRKLWEQRFVVMADSDVQAIDHARAECSYEGAWAAEPVDGTVYRMSFHSVNPPMKAKRA